ncbi:F-type H+-transporting ATPase subunit epsilon [Pedobacter sp. UYP30]|uniref:ATP synthase F1 subunit epsilon n=1 Tax=Pedobacter sp. UYP30 TaxID=1756400 RepID=UPI003393E2BA
MNLEILTPDKKIFDGTATSVTLPGTLGSFQILTDHAPIISTLQDGEVVVKTGKAEEEVFFIKGGVVEALHNKIVVLAEGIG